jgi:hypothetical protein
LILLGKQLDIGNQPSIDLTGKQTEQSDLAIPELGAVLRHEARARLLKGKVIAELRKDTYICTIDNAVYVIFKPDG